MNQGLDVDRLPLLSHRGNFSGKASAIVHSFIKGEWWRADPSTGHLPDTVERNAQFHINQGPVDVGVFSARTTWTPSSLPANNPGQIGTNRPTGSKHIKPFTWARLPGEWRELFIFHPFTREVPEEVEFSTIPTKY